MNSVLTCVMGELMMLLFIVTYEFRTSQRVPLCSRSCVLSALEEIMTQGGRWEGNSVWNLGSEIHLNEVDGVWMTVCRRHYQFI